jgi:FkbH-like protein
MRAKYLDLVKLTGSLASNTGGLPLVRMAVLGDHATQQMVKILRATLFQEGFWAEIYEAEFDDMQNEIFDPASGLHRFRPGYAWLCFSSQQYRRRFYHAAPEAQPVLPARWASEIAGLAQVLVERGQQVIINNLAPPRERLFGNFSTRTPASLHTSVLEANRELAAATRGIAQCYINDVAFLASRAGLDEWYDDRLWVHSKYPCAPRHFPEIAWSAASIIKATRGRLVKAVVLDLDNTLWGGVIGDDGLERIEIGGLGAGEAYEDFQRYLLQLKQRGIVLAVCSKNDEANARLPFREHTGMVLKESDIAAFVANWEPKSGNLRRISRLLNLGLDSFVFVDDSPFERNEVRLALPEVHVPELPEDPALFGSALEAAGYFETTTFTDDDRKRGDMYREEAERAGVRERATNIDDYLRSLEMRMVFRPLDALHLQRVTQLIQRSNQFNLCTRRWSEAQCRESIDAPRRLPAFYFTLRDKFGDYGLVSAVFAEVAGSRLEIREWVMSCRVLNRGVEQRIIGCLSRVARDLGLAELWGEYRPTAKNRMVADLYPRLGFQSAGAADENTFWTLDLAALKEPASYIQLDP